MLTNTLKVDQKRMPIVKMGWSDDERLIIITECVSIIVMLRGTNNTLQRWHAVPIQRIWPADQQVSH